MTGRSNKLNWMIFGPVDASQDTASLTEVLRCPTRPFFEVSDCPPATLILIAAFTSLSWKVPQKRHSHSRIFNAFLPPIFPQQEHRWDLGSHREIIRKLRPYLSDFADSISRKERHPKSDIVRDKFRFLTIPDVFKSSKTIVWFSRTTLGDSLCKKSVRVSLIFAWILATGFLAFSRRLLPFCFLERFFCAFLSHFNRFFNGFGALIFSPVERVAKVAIPRSIPTVCSLSGKVSGRISTTKLRK